MIDCLKVLRLLLAEERGVMSLMLLNAVLMPVCIAYLVYMTSAGGAPLASALILGLGLSFASPVAQVGMGVLHDRFDHRIDLLQSAGVSANSYFAARLIVGIGEVCGLFAVA